MRLVNNYCMPRNIESLLNRDIELLLQQAEVEVDPGQGSNILPDISNTCMWLHKGLRESNLIRTNENLI
jgi:hypothetical protein